MMTENKGGHLYGRNGVLCVMVKQPPLLFLLI